MAFPPTGYPFTNGDVIDADHVNEIIAELGSNPSGGEATVEARIAAVAASVHTIVANTQTGNYTLVLSDAGKVIEANSGSTIEITVPPNSSVAFPTGTVIELYAMGSGDVTVLAGSGVTVRNAGDLAGQYATASLRKRAADEWVLSGELA